MLACDVIARLIDFAGADVGDRAVRVARRAMQDAFREFPGLHRWTYHYTHGRLQLVQSYCDGTVQYVNSTRQLTLTGGVWPAWASLGDVRIGSVVSEVASRDSDTQLTISPTVNFGQDVAAGTGYSIYQDRYTLPDDFLASDAAVAETWFGSMEYVHLSGWLWATRTAQRVGVPIYYTFMQDRFIAGRYALVIWPYSDSARTLDFIYQRRLRRLKYDSVTAGKAAITGNTSTVAGTGTNWTADMVGSYLRLGVDATTPTGVEGANPAVLESKITAVGSATTLSIADVASQDLSGVGYMISDALDIEDGVMASAFCWQAIRHMADELRMKDCQKIEATALEALIRAKEHDARNFSQQRAGPGGVRRPSRRYMPTGPDEP